MIQPKTQVINIKQTINHGKPLRNPLILINEKGKSIELSLQQKYFFKYNLIATRQTSTELYNVISNLDSLKENVALIEKECIQNSIISEFLNDSKSIFVTENWSNVTPAKKQWVATIFELLEEGHRLIDAKSIATKRCNDIVIAEMKQQQRAALGLAVV